jgi:hypothetical protein
VSEQRKHVLWCNEYHQHTAPRCCDPNCWCRTEPAAASVPNGERVAEYERLRDAAYHAVEEAWLLKSEASQDHALRTSAALDAFVLPLLAAPKQDALREAAVTLAAFARTAPGREYERLTRAQLETCLLGLLARVAEESTGAAVRFAPLERGVTDVMELFDHAAPKQDALREACEWRGGLPACEREPKGEWRFCPYCGKPIRRGGNDV